MSNCRQCKSPFEITDADRAFYKKMEVPEPTLCTDCRQQRLMAYRNERSFYHRQCGLCGKKLISVYSPESGHIPFCSECWWGDRWDGLEYGRDFDFSRPFFDQFAELFMATPQLHMVNGFSENSDYSNYCYRVKDCYLLIASDDCENCHFANYLWNCEYCMDSFYMTKSKLCYECVDSHNCYHCLYSQKLENCSECRFCFDMKGCENCFGCAGLRQKSYHWFNKPLTKEEYQNRIKEMKLTHGTINLMREKTDALKKDIPHKFANLINCENCTGDNLKDSKNSYECYDSYGLEDCKNIINGPGGIKDSQDLCGGKEGELMLGGISVGDASRFLRFNTHIWNGCENISYCSFISSSKNMFGCASLRHKEYCILNKQYSKEDYEKLVPKIIEHMKSTGEWGFFFPITHIPFAYNETLAQTYFPITEIEAEEKGWKWKESKVMQKNPNEKAEEVIACKLCSRDFRIIAQESAFYKENNLSTPENCPDCRHTKRMELRSPHKLYARRCSKCSAEIKTTYSPERPETVYCEQCYLKTVY